MIELIPIIGTYNLLLLMGYSPLDVENFLKTDA